MKPKLSIVIALIVVGALIFSQFTNASAVAVIIDHFSATDMGQTLTDDQTAGTASSSVTGYGGERDMAVTVTGGTGTLTADDPINLPGDTVHYIEVTGTGSATGNVVLQYDGVDGSPILNFGLPPAYQDLISTIGAPNIGFHVEVLLNAVPVDFTIEIHDTAGDWRAFTFTIPGGVSGHLDNIILFSQLNASGTGSGVVNFNTVSAIQLTIAANTPGASFRMELFDAVEKTDRGDLPTGAGAAGYGNPRHATQLVTLGTNVDAEENDNFGFGGHTTDILGDDFSQYDDEDGISSTGNWSDGTGNINVALYGATASERGCLWGWLDFGNGTTTYVPDGDFDDINGGASEAIIAAQPLTQGITPLSFPLPSGAANAATWYARFRLLPDPNNDGNCADVTAPEGEPVAADNLVGGEVEDYRFIFNPTAITLQNITTAAVVFQTPLLLAAAGLLLVIGLGALALMRRRA